MNIVHINFNDGGGGAAIAAVRHCEAMKRAGHNSVVITVSKTTFNVDVHKTHRGGLLLFDLLYRSIHDYLEKLLNPIGTYSIMIMGQNLAKNKYIINADVIYLHWVNRNTLSICDVERILKLNKPTFWFMHDMFPITGGCHHSLGCNGYKSNCKRCPLIRNKKLSIISHWQLNKKISHWRKYENLSFVAPSKWLANCVADSDLAIGHRILNIPNVIDTDVFKPLEFNCKSLFGLDTSKKTILFSADLSGSIYKGSEFTIDCLKMLDPEKYEGFVIGNNPSGLQDILPIRIKSSGYLTDAISLVMAYNACDTILVSSVAENYPNVILEGMACGKPCVGFRTGGIPDLINHSVSGFIAAEKTATALLEGIKWLFENETRYNCLASNAREQIVNTNSYNIINNDFFEQILS